MKRLIINGLIIDGTGSAPRKGAVAIEDDKITKIADNISTAGFDEVIDAKGCVISPGFIDTHSHSDLSVFKTPNLLPKTMQGITTEFLGQDGVSMSPLPSQFESSWKKNIGGLNGINNEINWSIFKNTTTYLEALEKNGAATNLCYMVPHGNIRMEAMGLDARPATDEEIKKMCEIMEREMKAGGFGLSTGLIYIPCAYSETKELVELCKVSAKYDGPFVIHQRSEADTILESMEEVIDIGKQSGVSVHFSHFKLCGKYNAPLFDGMMELLKKAQDEGITVSLDQYPYTAGSTMLGVILPPWAHAGGTDKLMERLQSPEDRQRIKDDIKNGIRGWDNFVAFAGLDGILVTDVATDANKHLIGKSLIEIGKIRGKEPLDATFDLLFEEKNAVGMVDFYGLEEHVEAILQRPEHNVCTDGLLGGKPHPRAFGSFARVLGRYVREKGVISLETAVRKMTGKAADVFQLDKRGYLKEGYFADITIFNPDTIIDKGTYEDPIQYPDGIEHVIVNGVSVVKNGEPQMKALPGRILRKKS